ncbi:1-phosphofructokinase [Natroniella acetigena]|uniref:1-phosphofructokinase n=1 Tax=Natroniella acetigena TaxID=52004 RepID=UPI00200ADA17|nr:1-phosphofructokinase [Natroniella acetigena]MCK8828288.1 1-phosphofructokinase [Natroniella acetigena]
MIVTVTLNPALDKTIILSDFKLGQTNRVKEVREDIGGKGINVSKVVAELGGDTTALGLLGGKNGKLIVDKLDVLNISSSFTWIEAETRTNLKLVDLAQNKETEINELGPAIKNSALDELRKSLLQTVETGDFVVLTGSLPPNTPENIYQQLIIECKNKGVKVILDTSNQPLAAGIEANPYLVKPNLSELELLAKKKLESLTEIIEVGERIYQQGVEIVVVSLGAEGAVVISRAGTWKLTSPIVEVRSSVGAGDTLVGALALRLNQQQSLKEAVRYAVAASANTVTKAGTQICNKDELEQLLAQVVIEELS